MPSPDDAAALGAYGEAVEAARLESERKWGFGRVERLAALHNTDLLARFRRQQATWAAAYSAAWDAPILTRDLLQAVVDKAAAMQRAFAALDAWATEAGHRDVAPWVWETTLEDGTIVALVENDEGAGKVIAEGRAVAVYTKVEVARIIDAIPDALKLAKTCWTGAKFVGPDLPQTKGEWVEYGDEIPFGDVPADASREDAIAMSGGKPPGKLPPDDNPPREPSLKPKAQPALVAEGTLSANWEDDFA
jgi:hypothetical protein